MVKPTVEKEHGHIETRTRTPACKVDGSVYERGLRADRGLIKIKTAVEVRVS